MKQYPMNIDGNWVEPQGGRWFDTVNPFTGETWAKIAHGTPADVDRAVAAARGAFEGDWSKLKPSQRGRLLAKLADLMEENAARLAEIEVRDNGKLYAEMSAQTKYLAEWYRYYGGLADKIEGAVIPTDKANIFNFTR